MRLERSDLPALIERNQATAQASAPAPASELGLGLLTSCAVLAPVVWETRLDIRAAPRRLPLAGTLWARLVGDAPGERHSGGSARPAPLW